MLRPGRRPSPFSFCVISSGSPSSHSVVAGGKRLKVTTELPTETTQVTGRQKGGFVKGWFWRMYPRSGFRSGGTSERTLVPVFVPGEPSERILVPGFVPGEHPPKPPFSKTTLFVNPRSSLVFTPCLFVRRKSKSCRQGIHKAHQLGMLSLCMSQS